jgi:nitroreductase
VEVHEAIRTKRAVRNFAKTQLADQDLKAIVNAGRRAQSAKNRQAWHFVLIQERSTLSALSELGQYAGQLANAAVAIAILTPDPAERWSVMFDAGQAAAYMQLAAWELGIGSCPVTIYELDQARELLGFPEQLHLRAVLSLGYPADPADLSSPPKPGGRKSLSEVMSYDRWEGSSN